MIGLGGSGVPAISANGRYVAFASIATNLVKGDTNMDTDIFVHDRRTGRTRRVSVRSNGAEAKDFSYAPAISANGRHVAFESGASNLVNGDTNDREDVFVHDRTTHRTRRVSVRSNGLQALGGHSNTAAISQDGRT
ncbi:MAG: hypothetical protein V3S11_03420, partial [Elusimicrobiota bacterium]